MPPKKNVQRKVDIARLAALILPQPTTPQDEKTVTSILSRLEDEHITALCAVARSTEPKKKTSSPQGVFEALGLDNGDDDFDLNQ